MASRTPSLARPRGVNSSAGRLLLTAALLVALLGGASWGVGAVAKSRLAAQYPAPGTLNDVGGYRLHLHCMGEGRPTVILEAGLNDFSVHWARVQPELATLARVCVYDRAGLGWSEHSPAARTSATMIDELHTLLARAGITGPYILVGHSFGGLLMRLYAQRYPRDVAGVVLIDAAHHAQLDRVVALRTAVDQAHSQFRTLAIVSASGLLALSPATIPNRGLPEGALAQYRAILATTRYFETAATETRALEHNFAAVRAAEPTSLGNLPLVVLSRGRRELLPGASDADNDHYAQAWSEMQAELAALSSNSTRITADQSGHDIHLQQPELVVRAVRQVVQAGNP